MNRDPRRMTRLRHGSSPLRYGSAHRLLITTLCLVGLAALSATPARATASPSPRVLSEIVVQPSSPLQTLDSDHTAIALFATTLGPSLGLKDPAAAVTAKQLSGKVAQELRLAELSQSVSEFMAALAVWQWTDSITRHPIDSIAAIPLPAATTREWLLTRSHVQSLADVFRLLQEHQTQPKPLELRMAAVQTALEASQRATATWWDLTGWKDRIRLAKGQARLCGTWQWIVHNHKMHGEQKAVMIFPPAGQTSAASPMPTEMIILGDAIYLRWEQGGHVQEDSLLFIKEDSKIEGSFVNNTGGWGPISGKRLTPCQP